MKLVCINCPKGCHLEVEKINEKIKVTGNSCIRGETYAINELSNPLRTLTTTLKIVSNKYERLPVITSKPIKKDMVMQLNKYLKNVEVKAPIKMGEVIISNVLETGADLLASKSIEE